MKLPRLFKALKTKAAPVLLVAAMKLWNSVPLLSSLSYKKIVNECAKVRTFPDCLKIAKGIPLYKKDDKLHLEKYRPISLLSPVGKIIENVFYKQLFQQIKAVFRLTNFDSEVKGVVIMQ